MPVPVPPWTPGAAGRRAPLAAMRSAEAAVAYTPITARVSGITTFPVGYQIDEDYEPSALYISPGRLYQSAQTINAYLGLRVFRGLWTNPRTWVQITDEPGIAAEWDMGADAQGYVPWTGRLSALIVLYGTLPAAGACWLSFAVRPHGG